MLRTYQWLCGCCDGFTGLLLILSPAWTLRLMGIRRLPESLEMASFVGVFVLGVGLAYLTMTAEPRTSGQAARWRAVWLVTAIIRTLVAVFLAWQILGGRMEAGWSVVLATDLILGLLQFAGLKLEWLEPMKTGRGGLGA